MSIIVYTENWAGKFRKSTFEAICYARKIADISNKEVKNSTSPSLAALCISMVHSINLYRKW